MNCDLCSYFSSWTFPANPFLGSSESILEMEDASVFINLDDFFDDPERRKRYEIYLYHDPEMEIWFQRQCRVW